MATHGSKGELDCPCKVWCGKLEPSTVSKNLMEELRDTRVPRLAGTFAQRLLFLSLVLTSVLLLLHNAPPQKSLSSFESWPQRDVHLLIVSDRRFFKKFDKQAQTIECYAQTHGYSFLRLAPSTIAPLCQKNHDDFFFRKHCTVAAWLQSQPSTTVAVVLDGDVVAGISSESLSRWLAYPFDIGFYERSWSFEIMSGAYIARNTPFTRHFLRYWASFESAKPIGFSSSDNGAINLALLDALAVKGRHMCRDLYRGLTDPVQELGSYYNFVGCCKRLLGPAREHVIPAPAHLLGNGTSRKSSGALEPAGRITIFPRLFGPAVDGAALGLVDVRNLHPFHHGLKKGDWLSQYGGSEEQLRACRPFPTNGRSEESVGEQLRKTDDYWLFKSEMPIAQVPRWGALHERCFDKLWCAPLASPLPQWPKGVVMKNGDNVRTYFPDPGVEWHNDFVAGMYS